MGKQLYEKKKKKKEGQSASQFVTEKPATPLHHHHTCSKQTYVWINNETTYLQSYASVTYLSIGDRDQHNHSNTNRPLSVSLTRRSDEFQRWRVFANRRAIRETTVARAAKSGNGEIAELCDSLTGKLIAFHRRHCSSWGIPYYILGTMCHPCHLRVDAGLEQICVLQ